MKAALSRPPARVRVEGALGERFGRYELVRRLSSGGMAEVFVARCGELDGYSTLVAIKRMLPHLREDTTFVRLFKREARILARLRHSGIARVIEVGCVEGRWFMALELVPGRSVTSIMRTLLSSGQGFPPAFVAYLGAEVARTLDYVHTACLDGQPLGIVHRDISPQNLIVAPDGSVKLIDFGIAQGAAGDFETKTRGAIRGKAPYMSPEQLLGESVDARSDLFSLGVVLWEMAAGRRLFSRETFHEGAAAVLRAPIPPPPVPAPLANAIMRCLERDLRQRVATAHELAAELASVARELDGDAQAVAAVMHSLYGTQDEFEALTKLPHENDNAEDDVQADAYDEAEAPHEEVQDQAVAARVANISRKPLAGIAAVVVAIVATTTMIVVSGRPTTVVRSSPGSAPKSNAVVISPQAVPSSPAATRSKDVSPPTASAPPIDAPVFAIEAAKPRAQGMPTQRRKVMSTTKRPTATRASTKPRLLVSPAPTSARARPVLERLSRSPYEASR